MKVWQKIVTYTVILSMFCFLCVGYAALSDTLHVSGSANISVPSGLFIIGVETMGSTNVDKNEVSFTEYSTILKSTISRRYSGAGIVMYRVTILNNTKLTYSYRDIYFQANLSGYNGNPYVTSVKNNNYKDNSKIVIDCELKDAAAADKIVGPGKTVTFDVTYNVGSSLGSSNNYMTLVNFQFGINVEGAEAALDVIEDKFLNILNTQSTYLQLVDVLDNKYDGKNDWKSNYIGNVKGSSSEDSVAVNTLFAGQLQITVGKEEMDATVLIKHEDIDGNKLTGDDYTAVHSNGGVCRGTGCEMTLYLTVDSLERAGQYVPVYVAVFTCDRDTDGNIISDWYRIGDTYSGEANVVTYDGGNGTGSFVTDNWRAKQQSYQLVAGYNYNINGTSYRLDAYSYTISANVNIESIVMAYDDRATAVLQTLLDHAKHIIDNRDYAGTGIILVENVYESLSDYYTLDANGNPIAKNDITRTKLTPAISKLYSAVDQCLIQMEALSKENQNS